jgi:hypothetical protein
MKKVSTAAVKATKNFSQPKVTIGLDLGDRASWYCLLDEVGEVLQEQKLSTTPKAMREVFGSERNGDFAPITLVATVASANPPRSVPAAQEPKHKARLVELRL